jgi:hypothetical protein
MALSILGYRKLLLKLLLIAEVAHYYEFMKFHNGKKVSIGVVDHDAAMTEVLHRLLFGAIKLMFLVT